MSKQFVNAESDLPGRARMPGAQTGGRALKLLKILVEHGGPISLTEMAKIANLEISATNRMLRELEASSFAVRESDGKRYVVGGELIALASTVLSKLDVRIAARPELAKLVALTGETATLKLRDGLRRITIDGVESPHPVRRVISSGDVLPLHAIRSGWVMLAFMPESEVEEALQNAEDTDVSVSELRRALPGIRNDGYLISVTSGGQGYCVLTAPIFSAQGVAGAIAISGPTPRWNKETASEHVFEILESCGAISASLGHRVQTRATVGRHKFSTPPIEDASNSRDKTKKQAKNKIENEAD